MSPTVVTLADSARRGSLSVYPRVDVLLEGPVPMDPVRPDA